MPKFHIGVEIKTRSASANRIAMRSSSAKASRWPSLNARPLRRAYLASSASPSNSGNLSRQMSITSMSQLGRASRNRATNASAPAEDSEAARGEQRRWNSLGTPSLSSRHPARSPDRPDHRIRVGDDSDVLHRVVDRGIVPLGVHGRTAILGHNDKIALVGAGARGVLDRHVGAGAGAPESAKAPPSMMTSFCRSWMISAQRFGSSCRPSALTSGAGAEDALPTAPPFEVM